MSLNPNELFELPEAPPISEKALSRKLRKEQKARKQQKRHPKPVTPRGRNQARYIKSLRHNELTFGIGPAGVGKTYVPARVYGEMLMAGEIDAIYCARPNVAKNQHRIGFLPGDERAKIAPWMVPIFDGLRDSMSPSKFADAQRNGMIKEVPYEFIQGRTFRDAATIVDEAENCDLDDLYITLTRQGENGKMVVCGDPIQARIPNSGLLTVVEMASYEHMKNIGVIHFSSEDVVRSGQARQWVQAFRDRAVRESLGNNNTVNDFYSAPPSFLRG